MLEAVRCFRSESFERGGTSGPIFEDSRRLEDLNLHVRNERGDKNGYKIGLNNVDDKIDLLRAPTEHIEHLRNMSKLYVPTASNQD